MGTTGPIDAICNPNLPACQLLSLPGELRNRIYDYCAEPWPITLHPAYLRHRHVLSRMEFGGLRYCCRVMYFEFTPIYLARTTVSLQPSNIERYLSVFYPKRSTVQDPIMSSNTLSLRTHGVIKISLRLGEVLDLTPLAGLLARIPGMRIEIAHGAAINPMMRDCIELLRTILSRSCLVDFQHTVERILFRYSLSAEVVVKLHRGVTFDELFSDVPNQRPRQWLIQQHIPALSRLKIVMESFQGVIREPPIAGESAAWFDSLGSSRQSSAESPIIPQTPAAYISRGGAHSVIPCAAAI